MKLNKMTTQKYLFLKSKKNKSSASYAYSKLTLPKPTEVYNTYWKFAAERQAIFCARLKGQQPPWTNDPILKSYKFTNVYRASDRVSQYLIKNVLYKGDQSPEEVFFRTILFKMFNRIETWELLLRELHDISYANYSFERYDTILTRAINSGGKIYSAAYIMPSGGKSSKFDRKHRMHLKLIEKMISDGLPKKIRSSKSMRDAFELLRSYPSIGDFLAYQYITDLNYSTIIDFSEMEFVVPGPGARDGIRKCFSDLCGLSEEELIRVVAERQEMEFERLGLKFHYLWGRKLQLIDCQNIFCEVSKYARIKHPDVIGVSGRTRMKQKYHINPKPIKYYYPPKWGLNESIKAGEMP